MDDLISRQDAIDAVESITSSMSVCINTDECHGMKRMQRQAVLELANLSSAQTDRKKGKWISLDDLRGKYNTCGYKCSECGEHSDYEENFCPNCGAKMEGTE